MTHTDIKINALVERLSEESEAVDQEDVCKFLSMVIEQKRGGCWNIQELFFKRQINVKYVDIIDDVGAIDSFQFTNDELLKVLVRLKHHSK